jgi:transcriptional regulator with XRE-family HTH domain
MIDNGGGAGTAQIDEVFRLGGRIKEARVNKGLNLRELAEIVGCSVSSLSKIENGKTNPSLSMLHNVGAALGINVAALFSDQEPGEKIVTRAGSRPVMLMDEARPGYDIALERLVPYAGGHLLEGIINIIQPGGGSDTELQHDGEELGYVLEGVLELKVEGEVYRLGPGDSFCFRSEMRHSYRNPGSSVARVLWVNTPPTF